MNSSSKEKKSSSKEKKSSVKRRIHNNTTTTTTTSSIRSSSKRSKKNNENELNNMEYIPNQSKQSRKSSLKRTSSHYPSSITNSSLFRITNPYSRSNAAQKYTNLWQQLQHKNNVSRLQFMENRNYQTIKNIFKRGKKKTGIRNENERTRRGPVSSVSNLHEYNSNEYENSYSRENFQNLQNITTRCDAIIPLKYLYKNNISKQYHFSNISLKKCKCDKLIGEKIRIAQFRLDYIGNQREKLKNHHDMNIDSRIIVICETGQVFSFMKQYSGNDLYYKTVINDVEYIAKIVHTQYNQQLYIYMLYNNCIIDTNTFLYLLKK